MVFVGIEWVRGKPINRNVEAYIHFVGLIVLFALVIFLDVYHLFFLWLKPTNLLTKGNYFEHFYWIFERV